MRHVAFAVLGVTFLSLCSCTVKVEEKRPPLVERARDVDVKVDAPGVDVKVQKD